MFNFFTYANHGMLHTDNFVSKVFFVVTHHWMYSTLVPVKEYNHNVLWISSPLIQINQKTSLHITPSVRKLLYTYFHLSENFSTHTFICQKTSLHIPPSVRKLLYTYLHLSENFSTHTSICQKTSLHILPSVRKLLYTYLHLSENFSTHTSIYIWFKIPH